MLVPDGWPVKGYFALLRHTRKNYGNKGRIEPGHAHTHYANISNVFSCHALSARMPEPCVYFESAG